MRGGAPGPHTKYSQIAIDEGMPAKIGEGSRGRRESHKIGKGSDCVRPFFVVQSFFLFSVSSGFFVVQGFEDDFVKMCGV